MKKYLPLLVLFLSVNLIGQSYRTTISGTATWFLNPTDHINAIHADSVVVSGSDTITWNYPVLLEDYNLFNLDTVSASWVGRYSVQRQNGDEVYFNSNLDSVFFKTYLPVNSSWKMYDFQNGDYILATISSLVYMTAGPISDSAKIISLQQYNSINQQISGNFNSLSFIVSKSNGFFRLFDFNNFPNDVTPWVRTDAHRMTYGEVFDFNIGDEFDSKKDYSTLQAPMDIFVKTVTAKNNWAPDSVQYFFSTQHTWYTVVNQTLNTFYSVTPESLMIYRLDSLIFNEYPGEPVHHFPVISSYNMQLQHLGQCKPLGINYAFGRYVYDFDSSFYVIPVFEPIDSTRNWIAGSGRYDGYYNPHYNNLYFQYYLYFTRKGTDSCGSALTLETRDQLANRLPISIYPNPSSSEISINYFSNSDQRINLSIRNIEGKELFQNQNIDVTSGENNLPIQISELANGMYFIILQDDSGLHAIKFLKN